MSVQNSIDRLLEKFNLTSVTELEACYQLQANCHSAQMALLETQIATLERALYPHLIPNADVQRLLWIPGLGKVNAFTIYTEIDGITRFPSARQFCSYCRLVPGADNSAGRTRHRSGSKAGNRYLKLAFSHAAIRAVQYNPEIRAFFKAKARKKPIRIARALVALELAHRLPGPRETGGFQRALQEPAPESSEARQVATPGKPTRLTDSPHGGSRA